MGVPAVIDWGLVGELIWVSLVAGLAVTALFSVAIYGISRAAECRRTGTGAAGTYGALAVVALVLFAAIVVFGIVVTLQKR
jgi:uncharacterized protein YqgC (DUF456 family)